MRGEQRKRGRGDLRAVTTGEMAGTKDDSVIKIILLGDSAVGKSK